MLRDVNYDYAFLNVHPVDLLSLVRLDTMFRYALSYLLFQK